MRFFFSGQRELDVIERAAFREPSHCVLPSVGTDALASAFFGGFIFCGGPRRGPVTQKKEGLALPQVLTLSKVAGARYVTRRIVKVAFWACFRRAA